MNELFKLGLLSYGRHHEVCSIINRICRCKVIDQKIPKLIIEKGNKKLEIKIGKRLTLKGDKELEELLDKEYRAIVLEYAQGIRDKKIVVDRLDAKEVYSTVIVPILTEIIRFFNKGKICNNFLKINPKIRGLLFYKEMDVSVVCNHKHVEIASSNAVVKIDLSITKKSYKEPSIEINDPFTVGISSIKDEKGVRCTIEGDEKELKAIAKELLEAMYRYVVLNYI